MSLPVGDHLFGFRINGKCFLGDDPLDNSGRPLKFMMLFGLYLSTNVGIN